MKQVIFISLVGLLLGISIAELQIFSSYGIHILLAITSSLLLICLVDRSYVTPFVRVTLIVLCACLLGLIRTQYAYEGVTRAQVNSIAGSKQSITAIVTTPPDVRDGYTSFNVRPFTMKEGRMIDETFLIRVTTDRVTTISYGDNIVIKGIPKSVLDNSKTYKRLGESYFRKGVVYEMRFPEVTIVSHNQGGFLKAYTSTLHDWIKRTIDTYVREPAAGFINGILIGEKHSLSKEWYEIFTRVGLTHVIVLSGYNLAVLFAWTKIILRRTSVVVQNGAGVFSVLLLVLVSGAEAPAVRAGVLVLVVALASILRRQQDSGYFLVLTVFAMLLVNPFYFLYDISFQLSVAATCGLVYIGPIIEKFFTRLPKVLSDIVRDTSSAQIIVLPLQLFYFGTFSWVALFANILVLPWIPLLMILGVVVLLTSYVYPVAFLVGTCASAIASVLLFLVKNISVATNPSSFSINLLTLLFSYACIIIFIIKYKKT